MISNCLPYSKSIMFIAEHDSSHVCLSLTLSPRARVCDEEAVILKSEAHEEAFSV